MARPPDLLYAVDERPPWHVLALSTLQHIGVLVPTLITPLVIARAAGLPEAQQIEVVSLSMLSLGLGTFLLCLNSRFLGSGYMCPVSYTANYLSPALFAVQRGGLPLAYGMIISAGVMQLIMAPFLRRLRPVFPSEIAGLVIAIVGLTLASQAVRLSLGIRDGQVQLDYLAVAAIALGTMVALNIWTKGFTKMFCALLGMIVGVAASAVLGVGRSNASILPQQVDLVRLPSFDHLAWSFDPWLLPPFLVACIGATLKLTGDIANAQKINDSNWIRPNLTSVRGGVTSAGVASMFAGLVGASGISNNSASVGLSGATGVTSRSLGYAIAATWALLAFVPLVANSVVTLPTPVMGAALFFSAAFVLSNGLQMMTSRMLDPRKTIVISFSFSMAIVADVNQSVFASVPQAIRPLFDNSLTLGTICAVVLNLILRIGIRKRQVLKLAPNELNREAVEKFLFENGAKWGARREIVTRAVFGVVQALEVIGPSRDAEIEATFDEFNLDLRIRYPGEALDIPQTRPSPRDIMATERGEHLLAGYLLRRTADRVSSRAAGERAEVYLHYDH